MQVAYRTVCLSEADKSALISINSQYEETRQLIVLKPPLRDEFVDLPFIFDQSMDSQTVNQAKHDLLSEHSCVETTIDIFSEIKEHHEPYIQQTRHNDCSACSTLGRRRSKRSDNYEPTLDCSYSDKYLLVETVDSGSDSMQDAGSGQRKMTNVGQSFKPSGPCIAASFVKEPVTKRLLCCVRLSPEKGAHRFVEIVAHLREHLEQWSITPTLCGTASCPEYAQSIKERLMTVFPSCAIINKFLNPASLQRMFRETVLNIHPSLNDAYGMTIVEAAACGVVSVVSSDGSVGAVDLFTNFCGQNNPLLLSDMTNHEEVANNIVRYLASPQPEKLRRQQFCYTAANSWTGKQFATALSNVLIK